MSQDLVVWWVRQDQRLHDNPALRAACEDARARGVPLLCLATGIPGGLTRWGFARVGAHRRWVAWRGLQGLDAALRRHGQGLRCLPMSVVEAMRTLQPAHRLVAIHAQQGLAPQERAEEDALLAQGLPVQCHESGGLFTRAALPFGEDARTGALALPRSFTPFRTAVEHLPPPPPLGEPPHWPPRPSGPDAAPPPPDCPQADPRSIHPYTTPACDPAEAAALRHLERYLASPAVAAYKQTRNAPSDAAASTRWSPWLASGALSPRQAWAALDAHDAAFGRSEGSHWIRIELLWREYFRWLMAVEGVRLYHPTGLRADAPPPRHEAAGFERWRAGRTGLPLVDAGMRELAATGWLSNRLRQVCASALLHELGGDWRAGAAWFEAQLIDYDPHSNQGNWAYIAGYGTDPLGGRRFDLAWQARQHDPDGRYAARWRDNPAP